MGFGRVEMAYYLMASDAGIEMSECRLLEENNRAHFMTKRFDRDATQGKLHLQSFCALQHYNFNDVGTYSYEQLFETMRLIRLPYSAAEQLYRRMVFNVLARNCDDHTKNFAFLMSKSGVWQLAPAFDMCYAYRPNSNWVDQHALSINGKRKNINKADLLELAYKMNIKQAPHIISQVADVTSNWLQYAKKTGVEKELKSEIKKNLIVLK
jgi:serine/threonine-protein kinase HipA